jgi:hypothetical protein
VWIPRLNPKCKTTSYFIGKQPVDCSLKHLLPQRL